MTDEEIMLYVMGVDDHSSLNIFVVINIPLNSPWILQTVGENEMIYAINDEKFMIFWLNNGITFGHGFEADFNPRNDVLMTWGEVIITNP